LRRIRITRATIIIIPTSTQAAIINPRYNGLARTELEFVTFPLDVVVLVVVVVCAVVVGIPVVDAPVVDVVDVAIVPVVVLRFVPVVVDEIVDDVLVVIDDVLVVTDDVLVVIDDVLVVGVGAQFTIFPLAKISINKIVLPHAGTTTEHVMFCSVSS